MMFLILCVLFQIFDYCICDNVIDVDDFLSPEYMPTTILMLENPKTNDTGKFSNISDVTRFDGSFHKAIVTMGYHRQMMNEYLCRNYLAEQIVQDMSTSRVKKRMGAVSHGPGMSTIQMETVPTNRVQDELLNDEGSSNYKDWLAKSTTLEDIYRHYGMDKRSDATDTSEEKEEKVEEEEYDGQIAGYNYNYKPRPNSSPSKLGHSGDGIFLSSGVGGYPHSSSGGYPHSSSGGYPHSGGGGYSHSSSGSISYGGPSFGGHSGGGSYGAGPPIIHEQVIHIPKHHHHHIKYVDKKEGLTDLFEIALTALAFLSFGMFIVHVIMCISMTTNTTATAMGMMMPPNTATGTGGGQMTFQDEAVFEEQLDPDNSRIQDDEELTVETEETAEVPVSPAFVNFDPHDTFNQMNYRSRRNIPLTSSYSNNYSLNDLARRILVSIEAATFADKDDGACLRKSLCENNRYSRDLEDGNKIWIPIWSLGMSWLTSRLGIDAPPSTTMLDSLKASILGLGKANCEIIYQNCEVEKRRLELKENMKKLKR